MRLSGEDLSIELDTEEALFQEWANATPEAKELFDVWDLQIERKIETLEMIIVQVFEMVIHAGQVTGNKNLSQHVGRRILRGYMPTLFRHLSGAKVGTIAATLRLLRNMNQLGTTTTREMASIFEFGMKSLSKLVNSRPKPGKGPDNRSLYIAFLLSFLEYGTADVKKQLLETKDVASVCFKSLSEQDPALIKHVLSTFRRHVLSDDAVSRTTKATFFRSPKLVDDLIGVYGKDCDEELQLFMIELCTKPGHGICFKDEGWLPAKRAKIYNPILATLISHLHPLGNTQQQGLLLKILEACPELVDGWWRLGLGTWDVGHAKYLPSLALANKIINLPVPLMTVDPPLRTCLANILPPPLNRTNLSKALQHADSLSRYAASVTINLVLQKLEKVVGFVSQDLKSELVGELRRKLPDFQVIIGLFTTCSNQLETSDGKDTQPILMTLASTLNLIYSYDVWFPEQVAESRFDFGKLVQPHLLSHEGAVGLEMQEALFKVIKRDLQWWKMTDDKTLLSMILYSSCFAKSDLRQTAKSVALAWLQSSFAFERGHQAEALAWIDNFSVFVSRDHAKFQVLSQFINLVVTGMMQHPLKVIDQSLAHPEWSPMFQFALNLAHDDLAQIYLSCVARDTLPTLVRPGALPKDWIGKQPSLTSAWKASDFKHIAACPLKKSSVPIAAPSHDFDDLSVAQFLAALPDVDLRKSHKFEANVVRFFVSHFPGCGVSAVEQIYRHDILSRFTLQSLLLNILHCTQNGTLEEACEVLLRHPMLPYGRIAVLQTVANWLHQGKTHFFIERFMPNLIRAIPYKEISSLEDHLIDLLDTCLAASVIGQFEQLSQPSDHLTLTISKVKSVDAAAGVARILSRQNKHFEWLKTVKDDHQLFAKLLLDKKGPFYWTRNASLLEEWLDKCSSENANFQLLEQIAKHDPSLISESLVIKVFKRPTEETIRVLGYLSNRVVQNWIADQSELKSWSLGMLVNLCLLCENDALYHTTLKQAKKGLKTPTSASVEQALTLVSIHPAFSSLLPTASKHLHLVKSPNLRSISWDLFLVVCKAIDASSDLSSEWNQNWASAVSKEFPRGVLDRSFSRLLNRIVEEGLALAPLVLLATCIAENSQADPESLLDRIIGNDRFVKIVGADKSSYRFQEEKQPAMSNPTGLAIMQLVNALFKWNPTKASKASYLPALLRTYGATTTVKDRLILSLLMQFEQHVGVSCFPMCIAAFPLGQGEGEPLESILTSGMVQTMLDAIDRNLMAYSVQTFDVEELEAKEPKKGIVAYDGCFWLPLVNALLTTDVAVDLRAMIETNLMGMAVMATSSTDISVRRVAFTLLDLFNAWLWESSLRERNQLLLLMQTFGNAIVDRKERIPTVVALFVAQSLPVMLKPDHPLYPPLNRFLLARPWMDLTDIPMFYNLQYSGTEDLVRERHWMLRLCSHGLRTSQDYRLYQRRHVAEILLSFYHSPFADVLSKQLILEFLEELVRLKLVSSQLHLEQWLELSKPRASGEELEELNSIHSKLQ
jgi:hypothetical protein